MAKYNSYKYITLQRACKECEARRKTEQAEVSLSGDAAHDSTMLHHVDLEEHRPHKAISKKRSECIQNTWKCALELHTHTVVPID